MTIAVRPEGSLLGDGDDGHDRLTGRIEDINVLGSVVRVRLGVASPGGQATSMTLDTRSANAEAGAAV